MILSCDATMTFIVSLLHHLDYREAHDRLHLAFTTPCGNPCCHRDWITLQARCAAVRVSEHTINEKGATHAHP